MRKKQIIIPSSSFDKGIKNFVIITMLYIVIAVLSYLRFKA